MADPNSIEDENIYEICCSEDCSEEVSTYDDDGWGYCEGCAEIDKVENPENWEAKND